MNTEKNVLQQPDVVVKEVALKELREFVECYTYETVEDWKLEDEYPQFLKAIMKGLVVFTDQKPTYTLTQPIMSDSGEALVSECSFRTRIKPSQLATITKGLNVAKQQVEYTLRCLSYITGQGRIMLDKFDKFDYKVIEQISSVFF
jgi:hypothetical protein